MATLLSLSLMHQGFRTELKENDTITFTKRNGMSMKRGEKTIYFGEEENIVLLVPSQESVTFCKTVIEKLFGVELEITYPKEGVSMKILSVLPRVPDGFGAACGFSCPNYLGDNGGYCTCGGNGHYQKK